MQSLRSFLPLSPSSLLLLPLLLPLATAHAAVPAGVVDGQIQLASGLNQPQSVFVSAKGTVYVADSGNNRVVTIAGGVATQIGTGSYSLSYPGAVIADPAGDVYIADTYNARVIEVPVSGDPVQVASSLSLSEPITLALDPTGDLYIGDAGTSAIYEVPASGTAGQVSISNLSSVFPGALVADASGDLYIGDGYSNNVYELPAGGSTVSNVTPAGFTLNQPGGLVLDRVGNLYVLDTGNERVIEVPASDAGHPYEVPVSGLSAPAGLGVDAGGNLYVPDYVNDNLTRLIYNGSAVNLGQSVVGTSSTTSVTVNFELNAPATVTGFQANSMGDVGSEITQGSGGTCASGTFSDSGGSAIAADNPLDCTVLAEANPQFPGLRQVALQMVGSDGSILASLPTNQTGLAAQPLASPLTGSVVLSGFYAPAGVAISGDGKIVYLEDAGTDTPGTANVYAWNGLAGGSTLSLVSTGSFSLSWPCGAALNDEGDLYISDYELAEVIVVPADSSVAPYMLNTGSLLQTPCALAFAPNGDLVIGDNGPEGWLATVDQPGYLVKVPHNGSPAFIMGTSPVSIVAPDSLAFASNGDLYAGDAGAYDPSTDTDEPGDVVRVPADGSAPSVVVPSYGEPTYLSLDPADDLDVSYSYPGTIAVLPPGGGSIYPLTFSAPYDLEAIGGLSPIPSGQGFILSDSANGNFLLMDGTQASVAFPTTATGSESGSMTATVTNIGNVALTLGSPDYSAGGQTADFPIQTTTTCANSLVLDPASGCGIDAVFEPSGTGSFAASLTLSQNGVGVTPVVNLTGTEGSGDDDLARAPANAAGAAAETRSRPHRRPPHVIESSN